MGSESGPIVDETGNVLGQHQGAYTYTIGQRRGLNLTIPRDDGKPRYVLKIEPKSNTLVVGEREALAITTIEGEKVIWCGPAPVGKSRGYVQVRAHGAAYPCSYQIIESGSVHQEISLDPSPILLIESDQPIVGLAPGQGAVIYDGDRVVGSATVASAR